MSQEKLAEILGVDRSTVVRWERATTSPQPWHRPKLAKALQISVGELAVLLEDESAGELNVRRPDDLALMLPGEQDGAVERRRFLPIAALPMAGGLSAIVELLTPVKAGSDCPRTGAALTVTQAQQQTVQAKRLYQACRYQEASMLLPELLSGIAQLTVDADSSTKSRLNVFAADAYHVMGSIMLKLDDSVLATLAAQRSMQAADWSGDAVVGACSARIMTHALMRAGHGPRAISLATAAADSLRASPTEWRSTNGRSAFGALMLRAAVAAALIDDRSGSQALLAQAGIAATELGLDANDRWTGFGPTNVQIHRVHIALTLGDAGSAIDHAKKINLNSITLAERKACLLTDVAQAYLQWGRAAAALAALERAYHVAPEEVSKRPGRRICQDLVTTAHGPVRDRTMAFAMSAGLA